MSSERFGPLDKAVDWAIDYLPRILWPIVFFPVIGVLVVIVGIAWLFLPPKYTR